MARGGAGPPPRWAALLVAGGGAAAAPTTVEVYYSTTCPNCLQLIQDGALPLLEAGLPDDQVRVTLLPWKGDRPGVASAHLCALRGEAGAGATAGSAPPAGARFVACDLVNLIVPDAPDRTEETARSCAAQAGMAWDGAGGLKTCYDGGEGAGMLQGAEYARQIADADGRTPGGAPWPPPRASGARRRGPSPSSSTLAPPPRHPSPAMSELGPGAASFFDPHFHILERRVHAVWARREDTVQARGEGVLPPQRLRGGVRRAAEPPAPPRRRLRGGAHPRRGAARGGSGVSLPSPRPEPLAGAPPTVHRRGGGRVVPAGSHLRSGARPDAAEVLRELARSPATRGVRQILNFEPNWPRNGALGDLLDSPQWREGFGLLKTVGFSFDMQLNPPQYQKAVALLKEHLDTTVIINHLGCPTMADLTEKKDQYWSGMEALAALPNTYIKLSMLCYADPNWDESEVVVSAVHRVISTFGASRCMFASNYPVDVKDGWPAARLFSAFLKLAERYSDEERAHLFIGAAQRAYRWVQ
ncbi:unnamed protein product [Prorocentrum cordatum]|uniref:Amidohydrolase-related domain-containing protein n=1 Tax=Prorocentrum cordatum TaxID=2364126 RepID=A0ABN9UJ18_9DINO|nr:unnamed protein product [Polarella glacialis]